MDAPCTYKQLDRLRLLSSQHFFLHSASATKTIQPKVLYPVEFKPYIPVLVQYFQCRMGLSGLQVDIDSPAYHMGSTWLRHALSDPCLFHATLYASSAQITMIPGTTMTTNYITLYHHTKAIAALNTRIASASKMDDVTIAAVLLLVITSSLQKDYQAAEAHRVGLLRMVTMKGGLEELGFDGLLSQMITMNLVLPAVTFDQLDAFPSAGLNSPASSQSLAGLTLDRLRASVKGNSAVRSYMIEIFDHIWALLLAADGGEDQITGPRYSFLAVRDIIDMGRLSKHPLPHNMSLSESAMVKACLVSMQTLQYLLNDRIILQRDQLALLSEEMKSYISASDPITWIRYASQANLWVIMLGLAVSEDVQGRLWFLMNEKCVAMSIKATNPAINEQFWSCYRWTRYLIQARMALTRTRTVSSLPRAQTQ